MSLSKPPVLSLVIPAYNEERNLPKAFEKIRIFMFSQPIPMEIILMDDGSTDRTWSMMNAFVAQQPNVKILQNRGNMGKGYTVKRGMLVSSGQYAIFTDADLSYGLEEISKFLGELSRGYDVVVGSRKIAGSKIVIQPSLLRRIASEVFRLFIQFLMVSGVSDSQCGYKGFTRKAVDLIFPKLTIERFAFDVELFYLMRKYHLKIKEVPVALTHSSISTVRLIRDSLSMIRDILKIRFNDWKGKYG
jgi:dolichyl-phosphate beta-glucosyltransferase